MFTKARLRTNKSSLAGESGEDGQSLVEMAMVLPVLLLVLTGIFSFGLTFSAYIILTEATGTAARAVAISRGTTTDPCSVAVAAFYGSAPTLSQTGLTFTYVFNNTSAITGTSCSSTSTATGAAGNLVQGQPATLSVTYPCSLRVFRSNLVPNCVLKAQTTEIVQ